MATIQLINYHYDLYFDEHIDRQLENMAEGLLGAIPGVDHVVVHHDWAELKIDAEYVREQDSEEKYFDRLRGLCLEVASTVNTAQLLLTRIDGESQCTQR